VTENENVRIREQQEQEEYTERPESLAAEGILTGCEDAVSLKNEEACEPIEVEAETSSQAATTSQTATISQAEAISETEAASQADAPDSRAGRRVSHGARNSTRRMVTLALLISAAMVLSYVESLLPALATVPGVKVGLANAVTLFALYVLDTRGAICISVMRVSLSALLFGSAVSFIYSAAGAALSLLVMIILRRLDLFSSIGVSVAGGVAHNVGQVVAASLTLESLGILYYIAPLLISGTLAGAFIGVVTGLLTNKTKNTVRKMLDK